MNREEFKIISNELRSSFYVGDSVDWIDKVLKLKQIKTLEDIENSLKYLCSQLKEAGKNE